MIDYTKIKEIAGAKGVLDVVVEKDYILDWLLWGISQNEYLRERTIFKGGTALHKMYFPDWRFSEDLDFTTTVMIEKAALKMRLYNYVMTQKTNQVLNYHSKKSPLLALMIASGLLKQRLNILVRVDKQVVIYLL